MKALRRAGKAAKEEAAREAIARSHAKRQKHAKPLDTSIGYWEHIKKMAQECKGRKRVYGHESYDPVRSADLACPKRVPLVPCRRLTFNND